MYDNVFLHLLNSSLINYEDPCRLYNLYFKERHLSIYHLQKKKIKKTENVKYL